MQTLKMILVIFKRVGNSSNKIYIKKSGYITISQVCEKIAKYIKLGGGLVNITRC